MRFAWYHAPLSLRIDAAHPTGHPVLTPAPDPVTYPERLTALCAEAAPAISLTAGDYVTLGAQGARWTGQRWMPCTLAYRQGSPATAERPLAYGLSPLAPRGSYTQADHHAIAQRFARWIWDQGFFPVLPHLYLPTWLHDTDAEERAIGLAIGQAWLTQCARAFQLDVPPSAGMIAEHALAAAHAIPIEQIPWTVIDASRPYCIDP